MIKQILSASKIALLALVLSFGLSYVYAWTAPSVSPPNGNVAAPINTSATPQTKNGNLTISATTTSSYFADLVSPSVYFLQPSGRSMLWDLSVVGTITTNRLKVQNGAGTAGQVLTSDASGNASWVATSSLGISGGGHGEAKFTSNGTWAAPSGVTKIWVTASGGGGGGGAGAGMTAGGGGGSSAIMFKEQFTVTSGTTYNITYGTPGGGGVYVWPGNSGGVGLSGGPASIVGVMSVAGGGGGGTGAGGAGGVGGAAGVGGGANIFSNSANGTSGSPGGTQFNDPNSGAAIGGYGAKHTSTMFDPAGWGGDGGAVAVNGTAGKPGFLVIEW